MCRICQYLTPTPDTVAPLFLFSWPGILSQKLTGNLTLLICPLLNRSNTSWVSGHLLGVGGDIPPSPIKEQKHSWTFSVRRSSLTLEFLLLSNWMMALNLTPRFPKPYPKPSASLGISIFHTILSTQERSNELVTVSKNALIKFSQELHFDWVKLLLLGFLRLRGLPQTASFCLSFGAHSWSFTPTMTFPCSLTQ